MRISDILDLKGGINWNIVRTIPEFKALDNTPQSTTWHLEGNVWLNNPTWNTCWLERWEWAVGSTGVRWSRWQILSVYL